MASPDGWDRLERRAEREAGSLADRPGRTVVKWLIALAVLVLVSSAIFGVVSWISSWGGEAKRLTGPEHSREQVTAVLQDWNELQASAGNVCQAGEGRGGASDPTLIEHPEFAYAAQYRRIAADYSRRMSNFFEAAVTRKLPIPDSIGNLPRSAPSLTQMERRVC